MFAAMQWRKALHRSVALLVVASLLLSLLPAPATAAPSSPVGVQQQEEGAPVPEPAPPPQWPEVGERAQYVPSTEDLTPAQTLGPIAGETQPAPAVEESTAPPPIPELLLPTEPVAVVLGGGLAAAQVGTLPLALSTEGAETATTLLARVQMLPAEQAAGLSPLDFVFSLQLESPDAPAAVQASRVLTAVFDYSRIPLAHLNDVAGRLALYRATGCALVSPAVVNPAELSPGEADLPPAPQGIACADWQPLPVQNDIEAQQLLAQLPAVAVTVAVTSTAPAAEPSGPEAPEVAQSPASAPQPAIIPHLYLPFVLDEAKTGAALAGQNTAPVLPAAGGRQHRCAVFRQHARCTPRHALCAGNKRQRSRQQL